MKLQTTENFHVRKSSAEAASKFMSIVTDDILHEIFIRLHNARSVIQYRTVCKRWFSPLSDPQFIIRFIQYHHFYSAYTILFTSYHCTYKQYYVLLSKKSKILHGSTISYNDLNNILPESMCIKASFQDLLLVSRLPHDKNYSIYNPLTRQCVELPKAPTGFYDKCGFFGELNNSQFSYKVLLIIHFSRNENEYIVETAIFCSETGKWSRSTLSVLRTLAPPNFSFWNKYLIANNGILYSQLSGVDDDIRGFAAFDLSNNSISTPDDPIQCRFVHLPINFGRGWRACFEHVCHGVVRGQLRLSQLLKIKRKFVLKVWELISHNENGFEWLLVHEVRVKKRNKTGRMFVAAFHPNNGDVIFIFCDYDLYKYKIGQGKYEKVDQLPNTFPNIVEEHTTILWKFTLVHPLWPTLIPTLPSV